MEVAIEPSVNVFPTSPVVLAPRARSLGEIRRKILVALTLCVLLGSGAFLRIYHSSGYERIGFDENGYSVFVKLIQISGFRNYDDMVAAYMEEQHKRPDAEVPATRIGFLAPAVVVANVFKLEPWSALRAVSCGASLLLLGATAVIGYRLGGSVRMLAMTALMASAPLQIAFAQRAMIDGYFAFWAVLTAWFFWESWRSPKSWAWLVPYGVSLGVLILTKETAAFVFAALLATAITMLACARRRLPAGLVLVSVIVPMLAMLFLTSVAGGVGEWIAFYRMFVAKSAQLHYAVQWQDGAWYRYLIDFALLSPCIVALAFGRVFQIDRRARLDLFWALFLGFSFLLMSSVRYGMSLRFAAYWDEPLRWLAASQLILWTGRIAPRRANSALVLGLLLLMAVDLSQYSRLFVRGRIYDPISVHLMRASMMVK